jgi:4-hydroxy-tetrahydrodipicolinate synthase
VNSPLKPVTGVYAALLTPRFADGRLDSSALERNLEFCLSRGVQGFVLNGATGEYCLTTPDELRCMLSAAARVCAGIARFGAGVGSAALARSAELARIAFECGASFILAPPPYFFPYSADDVSCFCSALAQSSAGPVLLYNIPQFTSEIPQSAVLALLAAEPNIVGIKDSSGSLDILKAVSAAQPDACRIVGNDQVLVEALHLNVCDGIVSGIAGVLPELIRFLFGGKSGPPARFLSDLIARMSPFPVPWALKWLAESRQLFPATCAQPVSPLRSAQAHEFIQWFGSEWPPILKLL